jgi:hypothetical protein
MNNNHDQILSDDDILMRIKLHDDLEYNLSRLENFDDLKRATLRQKAVLLSTIRQATLRNAICSPVFLMMQPEKQAALKNEWFREVMDMVKM